jgi:two-component system chemotaxis response regulator CheB
MKPKKKIRVLIVDDSASVRQTLSEILASDPALEVMATASDPYVAAARIQEEVPDVITLDVAMPRMDGLTFLRKLMAQRPLPVVMCSFLVEEGSQVLMDALEAGAVDVILKPKVGFRQHLLDSRVHICDVVKAAAMARVRPRPFVAIRTPSPKLTADAMLPPPSRRAVGPTDKVVCIGASTGGTESLRVVLEALPADCPGIIIVQHMPETFTAAFSRRLDSLCRVAVKEAEDGDAVFRGQVLVAPGNRHLLLQRTGTRYRVEIKDGPLVSRHRPSVDVLFRSAARAAGSNGIGVIMTGMGDDGAQGMLEMRRVGAATVAEDESTCVVFGMPKEAIERGAVQSVVPLDRIAAEILRRSG